MKISIAIPTYEMKGHGVEYLEHSFRQLEIQVYKEFDVVITDHSKDDLIMNLCDKWYNKLDIKYFRNEEKRGSASANTRLSIEKSKGNLIKLLCQDDYLYNENSLLSIINAFDDSTNWLATAYLHTSNRKEYFKYHLPAMNSRIYAVNTLGTPSCITLRNMPDMPQIDDNLTYAYDCDFYKRFSDRYGPPKILDTVTIINYLWWGSVTSATTQEIISKELEYNIRKYE